MRAKSRMVEAHSEPGAGQFEKQMSTTSQEWGNSGSKGSQRIGSEATREAKTHSELGAGRLGKRRPIANRERGDSRSLGEWKT